MFHRTSSKLSKNFLRAVSLILAAVFTTTSSVSYAQGLDVSEALFHPSEVSILNQLAAFEIPEAIGAVQKIDFRSPSTLIHIQDAHGQIDAQRNIEKILAYLRDRYGFKTIFVEGGLEGSVSADLLKFFKDSKLNDRFAESLLQKGAVGGSGLFLLHSAGGVKAFGVEAAELYRKNLFQFREVYQKKIETERFIQQMKLRLSTMSSRYFNRDLSRFFKEWLLVQDSRETVTTHLDTLDRYAKKVLKLDLHDPIHQLEYPQLLRYFKLKDLEEESETFPERGQSLLKTERKRLLAWLGENGWNGFAPSLLLPERAGEEHDTTLRSLLERFYQSASRKGFRFQDYPHLSRQWGARILRAEIEAPEFFKEIETLTHSILNRLAKSKEEKDLISLYQDVQTLRKLFSLELTRKEFDALDRERILPSHIAVRINALSLKSPSLRGAFQTMPKQSDAKRHPEAPLRFHSGQAPKDLKTETLRSAQGDMLTHVRLPRPYGARNDNSINQLFLKCFEFYETPRQREAVIFENLLSTLRELKQTKAVLITGGFHQEGIESIAKAKGFSYVSITPKMTELNDSTLYADRMMLRPVFASRTSSVASVRPDQIALSEIRESLGQRDADYLAAELRAGFKEIGVSPDGPALRLHGLNQERRKRERARGAETKTARPRHSQPSGLNPSSLLSFFREEPRRNIPPKLSIVNEADRLPLAKGKPIDTARPRFELGSDSSRKNRFVPLSYRAAQKHTNTKLPISQPEYVKRIISEAAPAPAKLRQEYSRAAELRLGGSEAVAKIYALGGTVVGAGLAFGINYGFGSWVGKVGYIGAGAMMALMLTPRIVRIADWFRIRSIRNWNIRTGITAVIPLKDIVTAARLQLATHPEILYQAHVLAFAGAENVLQTGIDTTVSGTSRAFSHPADAFQEQRDRLRLGIDSKGTIDLPLHQEDGGLFLVAIKNTGNWFEDADHPETSGFSFNGGSILPANEVVGLYWFNPQTKQFESFQPASELRTGEWGDKPVVVTLIDPKTGETLGNAKVMISEEVYLPRIEDELLEKGTVLIPSGSWEDIVAGVRQYGWKHRGEPNTSLTIVERLQGEPGGSAVVYILSGIDSSSPKKLKEALAMVKEMINRHTQVDQKSLHSDFDPYVGAKTFSLKDIGLHELTYVGDSPKRTTTKPTRILVIDVIPASAELRGILEAIIQYPVVTGLAALGFLLIVRVGYRKWKKLRRWYASVNRLGELDREQSRNRAPSSYKDSTTAVLAKNVSAPAHQHRGRIKPRRMSPDEFGAWASRLSGQTVFNNAILTDRRIQMGNTKVYVGYDPTHQQTVFNIESSAVDQQIMSSLAESFRLGMRAHHITISPPYFHFSLNMHNAIDGGPATSVTKKDGTNISYLDNGLITAGLKGPLLVLVINDEYHDYLVTQGFDNFLGVSKDRVGWTLLSEREAIERYDLLKDLFEWESASGEIVPAELRLGGSEVTAKVYAVGGVVVGTGLGFGVTYGFGSWVGKVGYIGAGAMMVLMLAPRIVRIADWFRIRSIRNRNIRAGIIEAVKIKNVIAAAGQLATHPEIFYRMEAHLTFDNAKRILTTGIDSADWRPFPNAAEAFQAFYYGADDASHRMIDNLDSTFDLPLHPKDGGLFLMAIKKTTDGWSGWPETPEKGALPPYRIPREAIAGLYWFNPRTKQFESFQPASELRTGEWTHPSGAQIKEIPLQSRNGSVQDLFRELRPHIRRFGSSFAGFLIQLPKETRLIRVLRNDVDEVITTARKTLAEKIPDSGDKLFVTANLNGKTWVVVSEETDPGAVDLSLLEALYERSFLGQIGNARTVIVTRGHEAHVYGHYPPSRLNWMISNSPPQGKKVKIVPFTGQSRAFDIIRESLGGFTMQLTFGGLTFQLLDNFSGADLFNRKAKYPTELSITEDESNYYITISSTRVVSNAAELLKDTQYKIDKGLLVTTQHDKQGSEVVVTIPKKEVDRLAAEEMKIRDAFKQVSHYLRTVEASLGSSTEPEKAALRRYIPHLVRLLHLNEADGDAERRAWTHALGVLEDAPKEVARYLVDTLIHLGSDVPLRKDGRVDEPAFTKHPTGIPSSFYRDKYWNRDFPLRLAAIKLIGTHRLNEHVDRLIELLAPSFYEDDGPGHSDHYEKQRADISFALGRIAEEHAPTLRRLIEMAGAGYRAPWWVKCAAIDALGYSNRIDESVLRVLGEAYELNPVYLRSVDVPKVKDVNREIVGQLVKPSAMMALVRLQEEKIAGNLVAMLPDEEQYGGMFDQTEPEKLAAIKALGALKNRKYIPDLLRVFRNKKNNDDARKEAIWAVFHIDPQSKELADAVVETWNAVHIPKEGPKIPKYKRNPHDPFAFYEFVAKLIDYVNKHPLEKTEGDTKRTLEEVLRVGIAMGISVFIEAGARYVHDIDDTRLRFERRFEDIQHPEWMIVGEAIKKQLELHPHDQVYLEGLRHFLNAMREYWNTTYVSGDDLIAFSQAVAGLDYSYLDKILNVLRSGHKADDLLGNSKLPQVAGKAIELFGRRVFRDNRDVLERVPFRPAELRLGGSFMLGGFNGGVFLGDGRSNPTRQPQQRSKTQFQEPTWPLTFHPQQIPPSSTVGQHRDEGGTDHNHTADNERRQSELRVVGEHRIAENVEQRERVKVRQSGEGPIRSWLVKDLVPGSYQKELPYPPVFLSVGRRQTFRIGRGIAVTLLNYERDWNDARTPIRARVGIVTRGRLEVKWSDRPGWLQIGDSVLLRFGKQHRGHAQLRFTVSAPPGRSVFFPHDAKKLEPLLAPKDQRPIILTRSTKDHSELRSLESEADLKAEIEWLLAETTVVENRPGEKSQADGTSLEELGYFVERIAPYGFFPNPWRIDIHFDGPSLDRVSTEQLKGLARIGNQLAERYSLYIVQVPPDWWKWRQLFLIRPGLIIKDSGDAERLIQLTKEQIKDIENADDEDINRMWHQIRALRFGPPHIPGPLLTPIVQVFQEAMRAIENEENRRSINAAMDLTVNLRHLVEPIGAIKSLTALEKRIKGLSDGTFGNAAANKIVRAARREALERITDERLRRQEEENLKQAQTTVTQISSLAQRTVRRKGRQKLNLVLERLDRLAKPFLRDSGESGAMVMEAHQAARDRINRKQRPIESAIIRRIEAVENSLMLGSDLNAARKKLNRLHDEIAGWGFEVKGKHESKSHKAIMGAYRRLNHLVDMKIISEYWEIVRKILAFHPAISGIGNRPKSIPKAIGRLNAFVEQAIRDTKIPRGRAQWFRIVHRDMVLLLEETQRSMSELRQVNQLKVKMEKEKVSGALPDPALSTLHFSLPSRAELRSGTIAPVIRHKRQVTSQSSGALVPDALVRFPSAELREEEQLLALSNERFSPHSAANPPSFLAEANRQVLMTNRSTSAELRSEPEEPQSFQFELTDQERADLVIRTIGFLNQANLAEAVPAGFKESISGVMELIERNQLDEAVMKLNAALDQNGLIVSWRYTSSNEAAYRALAGLLLLNHSISVETNVFPERGERVKRKKQQLLMAAEILSSRIPVMEKLLADVLHIDADIIRHYKNQDPNFGNSLKRFLSGFSKSQADRQAGRALEPGRQLQKLHKAAKQLEEGSIRNIRPNLIGDLAGILPPNVSVELARPVPLVAQIKQIVTGSATQNRYSITEPERAEATQLLPQVRQNVQSKGIDSHPRFEDHYFKSASLLKLKHGLSPIDHPDLFVPIISNRLKRTFWTRQKALAKPRTEDRTAKHEKAFRSRALNAELRQVNQLKVKMEKEKVSGALPDPALSTLHFSLPSRSELRVGEMEHDAFPPLGDDPLALKAIDAHFGMRLTLSKQQLRELQSHLHYVNQLLGTLYPKQAKNFQSSYEEAPQAVVEALNQNTISYGELFALRAKVGNYIDSVNQVTRRFPVAGGEQAKKRSLQRWANLLAQDYNEILYKLPPDFFVFQPQLPRITTLEYIIIGLIDEQRHLYSTTQQIGIFRDALDPQHEVKFRNMGHLFEDIPPTWQMLLLPVGTSPDQALPNQVRVLPLSALKVTRLIVQAVGTGQEWKKGKTAYKLELSRIREGQFRKAFPLANQRALEMARRALLVDLGWKPAAGQRWLFLEPNSEGLPHFVALQEQDVTVVSSNRDIQELFMPKELTGWLQAEGGRFQILRGSIERSDITAALEGGKKFDYIVIYARDRDQLAQWLFRAHDWKLPETGGWYLGVIGGESAAELELTRQSVEKVFQALKQTSLRIKQSIAPGASFADRFGFVVRSDNSTPQFDTPHGTGSSELRRGKLSRKVLPQLFHYSFHGGFGKRPQFSPNQALIQGDDLAGFDQGSFRQSSGAQFRRAQAVIGGRDLLWDVRGDRRHNDIGVRPVEFIRGKNDSGALFNGRKIRERKGNQNDIPLFITDHRRYRLDYSKSRRPVQPPSEGQDPQRKSLRGAADLLTAAFAPQVLLARWLVQFLRSSDGFSSLFLPRITAKYSTLSLTASSRPAALRETELRKAFNGGKVLDVSGDRGNQPAEFLPSAALRQTPSQTALSSNRIEPLFLSPSALKQVNEPNQARRRAEADERNHNIRRFGMQHQRNDDSSQHRRKGADADFYQILSSFGGQFPHDAPSNVLYSLILLLRFYQFVKSKNIRSAELRSGAIAPVIRHKRQVTSQSSGALVPDALVRFPSSELREDRVRILVMDQLAAETVEDIQTLANLYSGRVEIVPVPEVGGIEDPTEQAMKKLEVLEKLNKQDAQPAILIVRSNTELKDEKVIQLAKESSVRVIIRAGSDTDNIDLEALERLDAGISVVRTGSRLVADLALRYLIAGLATRKKLDWRRRLKFMKDVSEYGAFKNVFDVSLDEFQAARAESQKAGRGKTLPEQVDQIFSPISGQGLIELFKDLNGKTIGLIGFGEIAQTFVAKLNLIRDQLRSAGADVSWNVVAWSPSLERGDPSRIAQADALGVLFQPRATVLSDSHIISIHVPGKANPIDFSDLEHLKLEVLINTARPQLFDPETLLSNPKLGKVLYFLDAKIDHDGSFDRLRRSHPNRIYGTPHIAASTPSAKKGVGEKTVSALEYAVPTLLGLESGTDEKPQIVNGIEISRPELRAKSSPTRKITIKDLAEATYPYRNQNPAFLIAHQFLKTASSSKGQKSNLAAQERNKRRANFLLRAYKAVDAEKNPENYFAIQDALLEMFGVADDGSAQKIINAFAEQLKQGKFVSYLSDKTRESTGAGRDISALGDAWNRVPVSDGGRLEMVLNAFSSVATFSNLTDEVFSCVLMELNRIFRWGTDNMSGVPYDIQVGSDEQVESAERAVKIAAEMFLARFSNPSLSEDVLEDFFFELFEMEFSFSKDDASDYEKVFYIDMAEKVVQGLRDIETSTSEQPDRNTAASRIIRAILAAQESYEDVLNAERWDAQDWFYSELRSPSLRSELRRMGDNSAKLKGVIAERNRAKLREIENDRDDKSLNIFSGRKQFLLGWAAAGLITLLAWSRALAQPDALGYRGTDHNFFEDHYPVLNLCLIIPAGVLLVVFLLVLVVYLLLVIFEKTFGKTQWWLDREEGQRVFQNKFYEIWNPFVKRMDLKTVKVPYNPVYGSTVFETTGSQNVSNSEVLALKIAKELKRQGRPLTDLEGILRSVETVSEEVRRFVPDKDWDSHLSEKTLIYSQRTYPSRDGLFNALSVLKRYRKSRRSELRSIVEEMADKLKLLGEQIGTILMIDDDPDILNMYKDFLGRSFPNQSILYASDGQGGLNLFAENKENVGLVTVDRTMPGISGEEVIRQIREQPSQVPIIVVSGEKNSPELDKLGNLVQLDKLYFSEFMSFVKLLISRSRAELRAADEKKIKLAELRNSPQNAADQRPLTVEQFLLEYEQGRITLPVRRATIVKSFGPPEEVTIFRINRLNGEPSSFAIGGGRKIELRLIQSIRVPSSISELRAHSWTELDQVLLDMIDQTEHQVDLAFHGEILVSAHRNNPRNVQQDAIATVKGYILTSRRDAAQLSYEVSDEFGNGKIRLNITIVDDQRRGASVPAPIVDLPPSLTERIPKNAKSGFRSELRTEQNSELKTLIRDLVDFSEALRNVSDNVVQHGVENPQVRDLGQRFLRFVFESIDTARKTWKEEMTAAEFARYRIAEKFISLDSPARRELMKGYGKAILEFSSALFAFDSGVGFLDIEEVRSAVKALGESRKQIRLVFSKLKLPDQERVLFNDLEAKFDRLLGRAKKLVTHPELRAKRAEELSLLEAVLAVAQDVTRKIVAPAELRRFGWDLISRALIPEVYADIPTLSESFISSLSEIASVATLPRNDVIARSHVRDDEALRLRGSTGSPSRAKSRDSGRSAERFLSKYEAISNSHSTFIPGFVHLSSEDPMFQNEYLFADVARVLIKFPRPDGRPWLTISGQRAGTLRQAALEGGISPAELYRVIKFTSSPFTDVAVLDGREHGAAILLPSADLAPHFAGLVFLIGEGDGFDRLDYPSQVTTVTSLIFALNHLSAYMKGLKIGADDTSLLLQQYFAREAPGFSLSTVHGHLALSYVRFLRYLESLPSIRRLLQTSV